MPLAIVYPESNNLIVFGRWELENNTIVLKFMETEQVVSRTPIGISTDFEEFYDVERELHFFCIGTEFAVVAERDNREELDAFIKLYKRVRNIYV
jgi:hypothetical protein